MSFKNFRKLTKVNERAAEKSRYEKNLKIIRDKLMVYEDIDFDLVRHGRSQGIRGTMNEDEATLLGNAAKKDLLPGKAKASLMRRFTALLVAPR